MSISLNRNIGLSVEFRLWQILLGMGYYTEYLREPLTQLTLDLDTYDYATNWTYGIPDAPFGWVAVNSNSQADGSTVAVFVGGVQQATDTYQIDFRNGWIIFHANPGGAVTASFNQWDMGVRKGFVQDSEVDQLDIPLISWEIRGEDAISYAIGTATEFVDHDLNLECLLNNEGALDDVPSSVRKLIAFIPVYDFTSHQVLGYGNALDTAFNPSTQFIHNAYFMRRPSMRKVDIRTGQSEKLRYRAVVHAEIRFVV